MPQHSMEKDEIKQQVNADQYVGIEPHFLLFLVSIIFSRSLVFKKDFAHAHYKRPGAVVQMGDKRSRACPQITRDLA